jgi:non-specific serine/threonine protein kinase
MMQMDPLNSVCWMFQGAMHFWDGRFELALERLQKAYQMFPENLALLGYYADSLARSNMVDQAISIIDQMATASPNSLQTKWKILLKYGLRNDRDRLFQELTEDFKKNVKGHGGGYWVAVPLALVSAKKEALDWLENAINRGFINYPMLAEKDPFLANIRDEERFKKLLEGVKYDWEHFEV